MFNLVFVGASAPLSRDAIAKAKADPSVGEAFADLSRRWLTALRTEDVARLNTLEFGVIRAAWEARLVPDRGQAYMRGSVPGPCGRYPEERTHASSRGLARSRTPSSVFGRPSRPAPGGRRLGRQEAHLQVLTPVGVLDRDKAVGRGQGADRDRRRGRG